MNSYTDTRIIECARLHSEEALSGNNQNYSLWTNNLTDIIHLDAGDQISLHGAMISERGAGQSQSIEIKGVELGPQKNYTFTEINSSGNASDRIPFGHEIMLANLSTKTVNIRDDTAVFLMSYYITADGHNYIQLPRRWWWNHQITQTDNYTNRDIGEGSSGIDMGRSLWDPFNASTGTATSYHDTFQLFDDYYQQSDNRYGYSKLKNDGRRYTIMIRDRTYYSQESAVADAVNYVHPLPGQNVRDPENCSYFKYTELKEIQIPKGFNSPDYIATEVTRQLQEVTEKKTFSYRVDADLTGNASRPGFPITQYTTYSTQTYKPFECAWHFNEDTKSRFLQYINVSNDDHNASGWDYHNQYSIVGCLRPELYETGRQINRVEEKYYGIEGTGVQYDIDVDNHVYLVTKLTYTKENLDRWKAFLEAQEKYPEVFNIFSDTRTPYDKRDTIENCRWFHINRYTNASMSINGDQIYAQLGWGGYLKPSWRTTQQLSALIMPYVYDSSQKDTYYTNPDDGRNQLTYGCFGRSSTFNQIKIKLTAHNGWGSNLFNHLLVGGKIESTRSCGFDQHFSAVGCPWILPYSGITSEPATYDDAGNYISGLMFPNGTLNANGQNLSTKSHISQLYLGADSPELNWDGTHFSIAGLHTAINRGNDHRAGVEYPTAHPQDINTEAGDVVYKINPVELYHDWTPTRMPYRAQTFIYKNASHIDANKYTASFFNENLTPWQIYDASCGVFIEDFNLTEEEWQGSFWERLGFSYKQFHSSKNTRLSRIDYGNANDLSVITTNSEIDEGDTKIYYQNFFKAPMYTNMLPQIGTLLTIPEGGGDSEDALEYFPQIIQKTQSINIIADNLPTRMIRGYYAVRSNILENNPFIGGKKNNTIMPIIAIVDKINGDGDFYFQQESPLVFTITKPLRLASITCSITDPDGSFANTNEQNTVLFKLVKNKQVTFNVLQELLQGQKGGQPKM